MCYAIFVGSGLPVHSGMFLGGLLPRLRRWWIRPVMHASASLLVLLHALESLFKLDDQRSLARRETVTTHDTPEIITTRPVRIVHGHHIFGRPACYKNDDGGFGGLRVDVTRPYHFSRVT